MKFLTKLGLLQFELPTILRLNIFIPHVRKHSLSGNAGIFLRKLSSYNSRTFSSDILTECSSHHQGESEEVRTNVAIYSHALLRIHVIGGQRSVRVAPPSLPPHHSGLATRDFQSSISVEALL